MPELKPRSGGSEYFSRPDQTWSINFRGRDLAAMVGSSALHHPEGNPIEFW